MRQREFSFVFLVCAALAAIYGCRGGAPPGRPPVPVSVAQAVVREVPVYVDSIGSVSALQSVNIVPQVSGKLLEIHFLQGADLKKGDLLFSIDPRPFEAALREAESKLAKDKAQLALHKAQLKRSLALVSGNYVSAQDIEALEAKVREFEAAVQGSAAAVETAKINLDYCTIRSPLDGVAGTYQVDAGNVVSSLVPAPLVSVQHVDTLYVDFSVTENDLIEIQNALRGRQSLPVEVTSLSDARLKAQGELRYIDNQVLPSSGKVMLRAVLPNQERLFWPGLSIKARVILEITPQAVLIPYQAMQFGAQGSFVFVVTEDKKADLRVIEAGQRHDDMVAVKRGLEGAETVVLTGHLMLAPGSPVMVLPAQEAPPKS